MPIITMMSTVHDNNNKRFSIMKKKLLIKRVRCSCYCR